MERKYHERDNAKHNMQDSITTWGLIKSLLHVSGNCTSNTLDAPGQDGRIVRTTDPSQLVHAFNAFLNWKWKDTRTKNTSGEKAVEH